MNRSVVVIPVERATDVARSVRVAAAIAAASADVHLVQVMTAGALWGVEQESLGLARWSPDPAAPASEDAVIRTVRVRGKVEAIIPAYAQLVGARAIVVERDYGTPGIWRGPRVVRRLSRSSPVPVLVLPPQGPANERVAGGLIARVVVAIDSSVASAVALKACVALARRHDAQVTMLHAMENVVEHMVFSGSEAWRVMQQLPAKQRRMAGQRRHRAALFGDTTPEARVVTGDPGLAIVSAASEGDADLVIMGDAPRTAFDQWALGSTLRTVLRRVRTPVLVVPVVGGAEPWYESTFGEGAFRVLAEHSPTHLRAA